MTLMVGIKFIIKPIMTTKDVQEHKTEREKIIQSIICGVIIGFICGFVGAGVGILMVSELVFEGEYL